ncbi:unnamed protein product [Arabis nemorensis]|uniref:Uncharacterized protein n=1 Tax=Arabis nemorensis TaxID=586526 RepID=A0A565C9J1_9BRAS|nr:unnamed protein product [Arabis nemorensis]
MDIDFELKFNRYPIFSGSKRRFSLLSSTFSFSFSGGKRLLQSGLVIWGGGVAGFGDRQSLGHLSLVVPSSMSCLLRARVDLWFVRVPVDGGGDGKGFSAGLGGSRSMGVLNDKGLGSSGWCVWVRSCSAKVSNSKDGEMSELWVNDGLGIRLPSSTAFSVANNQFSLLVFNSQFL